tara:strand:+ start:4528 stop:6933 length:2406 start_codon:yes stop_codon:yes gene_type:complete
MKYFFIILSLTFLFSQSAPSDINILSVTIEGNDRFSDQDVLRHIRLYPGMKISGEDIQDIIKRTWSKNIYSDIQIYMLSETIEGINLLVQVQEFPILNEIKINGNDKESDKKILKEIDLALGQILSDVDISKAINKIREYYYSKHYHNIDINYSIESSGLQPSRKNIIFNINEGKKIKIKEINIAGNSAFSDKKIIKQFKNTKSKNLMFFWRGKWDEEKFEEDKKILKEYYKNKGYRDFYIVNEQVSLNKTEDGIIIDLDIYEGPKYFYRNITWDGNVIYSDEELNQRLGIMEGDSFNQIKLMMSISENVNPLYMDDGYFHFQAIPKITPISKDSLDINFLISEGELVTVRKIIISGNAKTYENVVRRELMIYPGDTFSRKKLLDSYRDIFMLNFFNDVAPNVIPVGDDEIDILFDVDEKEAGQANFSMGYSGVTGFQGGGGFQFPNFLGRGQLLSLSYNRGLSNSYQMSGNQSESVSQSFNIEFQEPWLLDTPNLVGGSFYYQETGQTIYSRLPFDQNRIGGSLTWGRKFKWPDAYFRGNWRLSISKNSYLSENRSNLLNPLYFGSKIDSYIEYNGDDYLFSNSGVSLSQIISRDSRNHPEFPTSGSSMNWTSTLSGSFLGGEEDYHKHVFDLKWFSPLYEFKYGRNNKNISKFALFQNVKVGVVKSIPTSANELSTIPPSSRFLMGGTNPYGNMLRGYEENSVGVYYGKILFKYSAEIRISLSDSPTMYLLMFMETGNVWSDFNDLKLFELNRSVGFGGRIFMPMIGMLGYDIGYGIDIDKSNPNMNPWQYHFIFGVPF